MDAGQAKLVSAPNAVMMTSSRVPAPQVARRLAPTRTFFDDHSRVACGGIHADEATVTAAQLADWGEQQHGVMAAEGERVRQHRPRLPWACGKCQVELEGRADGSGADSGESFWGCERHDDLCACGGQPGGRSEADPVARSCDESTLAGQVGDGDVERFASHCSLRAS